MFYTFRLGRSYLDALAMVPPLADVASNPELVCVVYPTAGSTKGFTMITVIFSVCFVCCFSVIFYLWVMCLSRNENDLERKRIVAAITDTIYLYWGPGPPTIVHTGPLLRLLLSRTGDNFKNSLQFVNHTKQTLPIGWQWREWYISNIDHLTKRENETNMTGSISLLSNFHKYNYSKIVYNTLIIVIVVPSLKEATW